jgi:hypothetical protein
MKAENIKGLENIFSPEDKVWFWMDVRREDLCKECGATRAVTHYDRLAQGFVCLVRLQICNVELEGLCTNVTYELVHTRTGRAIFRSQDGVFRTKADARAARKDPS